MVNFLGEPCPVDESLLKQAAHILRAGGLVVMPTETVYGLAANALDALACAKIFELKGRPTEDPLIVHVGSMEAVEKVAIWRGSEVLRVLAAKFWPGPFTVVLPKKAVVPDIVTSGLETVAVRCPAHPVALRLLKECGMPLAAPSANRFGRISPTSAEAVRAEFGERTPFVLDGGVCRGGLESTIVRWREDLMAVEVLRPGLVSAESITKYGQYPVVGARKPTEVIAPGMLESHYAPGKPLFLLKEDWRESILSREVLGTAPDALQRILQDFDPAKWMHTLRESYPDAVGWLLQRPANLVRGRCLFLSEHGNESEVASCLYASMRSLDEDNSVNVIFAELSDDSGLGVAVNDRLRRASIKRI